MPKYRYAVYGLSLESNRALKYPRQSPSGSDADVAIQVIQDSSLKSGLNAATHRLNGLEYSFLPDGSVYLHWPTLAEFLVSSDGRQILCSAAANASAESWQTYLLGQVLSFALIKNGMEPLHATVVVVNGAAVGFLGGSGQGKSTLAAAFLQDGHRLLTDDLLIVREHERVLLAFPGPRRIKLFPDQAHDLLGASKAAVPMNGTTSKLVIPLRAGQYQEAAVPLRALYVLHSPKRRSTPPMYRISRLRPRSACIELLRHTFNSVLVAPDRIRRQFDVACGLAMQVPVKRLSYPRDLANLFPLREAVIADVDGRGCAV